MRVPVLLVLLIAAAMPAAAATPPKLPRGDDVFRLGMSRDELKLALLGAGMRLTQDEPDFVQCEGRDPRVEYEQYSFYALAHGAGVLWRVTFAYKHDLPASEFAEVDSLLRPELGGPTDSLEVASTDHYDSVPERRLRWIDDRTMVMLAARWPKSPQPADRMIVEWSDLKLRRSIGAAANRPRSSR